MASIPPKSKNSGVHSLFTYVISGKANSSRVMFVYALKGRGKEKGIVEFYKGKFIAPACFFVPYKNEGNIIDVFNRWGVKFKRYKIRILKD